MSKVKLGREHLSVVTRELQLAGVKRWQTQKTQNNHMQVIFDWNGRTRVVTLSSTADWRGQKNTRSIVRGILAGVR